MQGIGWGLVLLCALACSGGGGADDGGADGSVDAGTDVAEDAGPMLCESAEPGCVGACQLVHDCVAQSSVANVFDANLFAYLGFVAPEYDDCSTCIDRCAEDEPVANAGVRECFRTSYETSSCGAAADPTVGARAVNTCCAGATDSRFCIEMCFALLATNNDVVLEVVPECQLLVTNELVPPTCAGPCPEVTSAVRIPVSGDAEWTLQHFAIGDDGTVAVDGFADAGTIDFGAGAHVLTSRTQVLAVFEADGTPRWSRTLSGGYGALRRPPFGTTLAIDDAGNITIMGDMREPTDLGAGELVPTDSDVIVGSWTREGVLRFGRMIGGPGNVVAQGVHAVGTDVIAIAFFSESTNAGGDTLTSAGGTDVLVARYDGAGAHLWSRRLGGPDEDLPWTVVGHPSGEYTITGGVSEGADFGDGPIVSEGDQDSFVARFDGDGMLRWKLLLGGPNWDIAYQAAADGEALVVSDYLGLEASVEVGGETLLGFNQAMLRLDADGAAVWVEGNQGFVEDDDGFVQTGLSVSPDARVVRVASGGNPDVGGGRLAGSNGPDIVVGVHEPDGSHRWSMRFGGRLVEERSAARHLASGELLLVGEMLDQLDWGGGVLMGEGREMFILRFAPE